jgi:hypothetical protein
MNDAIERMIVTALTWPEAVVRVAWIAVLGLVLGVLIWSIFRTGRAAIRSESGDNDLVDRLRTEVGELRTEIQRLGTTMRS